MDVPPVVFRCNEISMLYCKKASTSSRNNVLSIDMWTWDKRHNKGLKVPRLGLLCCNTEGGIVEYRVSEDQVATIFTTQKTET
jgi:hypothetical protein